MPFETKKTIIYQGFATVRLLGESIYASVSIIEDETRYYGDFYDPLNFYTEPTSRLSVDFTTSSGKENLNAIKKCKDAALSKSIIGLSILIPKGEVVTDGLLSSYNLGDSELDVGFDSSGGVKFIPSKGDL